MLASGGRNAWYIQPSYITSLGMSKIFGDLSLEGYCDVGYARALFLPALTIAGSDVVSANTTDEFPLAYAVSFLSNIGIKRMVPDNCNPQLKNKKTTETIERAHVKFILRIFAAMRRR
ncbi:MAG: hypothetical protein EZS28_053523, partial [Streblomastix strix]